MGFYKTLKSMWDKMNKGSFNLVSILSTIIMAAVGVEITTHLEDLEAYLEVNRKRQLRLPPLQRLQLPPQGEQLQQHQTLVIQEEVEVADVAALKGIPNSLAPIYLSVTMGLAIRFVTKKLASNHAKTPMGAIFGFLPQDLNPIEDFEELVI